MHFHKNVMSTIHLCGKDIFGVKGTCGLAIFAVQFPAPRRREAVEQLAGLRGVKRNFLFRRGNSMIYDY